MGENGRKTLAAKARAIYSQHLKQTLEACCRGQFVAIEVDSGEYFLGSTPLEAIKSGKAKYPEKPFHVMKVGYKSAILLKTWRLDSFLDSSSPATLLIRPVRITGLFSRLSWW